MRFIYTINYKRWTICDRFALNVSTGLLHNHKQLPLRSPELSIGPGYTFWSPIWYLSQLSKPTYFFHCLNQRLSTRYLKWKKTYKVISGMLLLPNVPVNSYWRTCIHQPCKMKNVFLSGLLTIISISYQQGLELWAIKDPTNHSGQLRFCKTVNAAYQKLKNGKFKKIFPFLAWNIISFNSCSQFVNSGDSS